MLRSLSRNAALGCLLAFVVTGPVFSPESHAQKNSARASYEQASKLYRAKQYVKALSLAQQAAELARTSLGPNSKNYALTQELLAAIYFSLKRYSKAESHLKSSLSIHEKSLGKRHPNVAALLTRLANVQRTQGHYRSAVPNYERAVSIDSATAGRTHSKVAAGLANLAFVHTKLGQYAEAEPLMKRSLAIYEKTLGRTHKVTAGVLHNLAFLYKRQGRYAEAEPLYRRSLAIFEKANGRNHPRVADNLLNLAGLLKSLGRFTEAEPLYKRVLAIDERVHGNKHARIATGLNNLAGLYEQQGRYKEAEALFKRALAISKVSPGESHPDYATTLANLANLHSTIGNHALAETLLKQALAINDLALGHVHPTVAGNLNNLAEVYRAQGEFAKAEPLYRRALKILEDRLGPKHAEVGTVLANLANLYSALGRFKEAISLHRRSLVIFEHVFGKDHPNVAGSLNDLGTMLDSRKRYSEAETLLKRAVTIREKSLGPYHDQVAQSLNNLAILYKNLGRSADVERLYKRSLAIYEKSFGSSHPTVAKSLLNLAALYVSQGRNDTATPLYERALSIVETTLGDDHPLVADALGLLGRHQLEFGQIASGFDLLERAARIHETRMSRGTDSYGKDLAKVTREAVRDYHNLAGAAWTLSRKTPQRRAELLAKAFRTVQSAGQTSASAALTQMAARTGTGDTAIARKVRARQDLLRERADFDKKLLTALSATPKLRDDTVIAAARMELASLDGQLAKHDAELRNSFPAYAQLSNPRPLPIREAQALLASDEALVSYLVSERGSYVWTVTRDAVSWKTLPYGKDEIERHVSKLRKSLDPVAAQSTDGRGLTREQICRGFERIAAENTTCEAYDTDLGLSHLLYKMLLAPVEKSIADKHHLIIVPSGPLTGLPFHMLVSKSPPASGTLGERFKAAEWLIRRHAVSVLPSISSLKALRVFASKVSAPQPFIGIGDPTFVKPRQKRQKRTNGQKPRGFADYFRHRLADVDQLSGAIPPLPDTADELKTVGKVLKARKSDIILGRNASETTLKTMSANGHLDDYRVVHFATHGLVAGEIKGLAEPALALSLPSKATETDDGLLTASEVAQLKLNADWVVLSACNTAAGDKPGAEALSGLSRSFFYSGTRALLVSHWPVVSEAAVQLTTRTFASLKVDPTIGRAEALRRSMLSLIDEGKPYQRHPSYWAPFIVVGEGGRVSTTMQSERRRDSAAGKAWAAIEQTDKSAELKTFIERFPEGIYADFAKARLKQLKAIIVEPPRRDLRSETDPPINQCDQLAANPKDPQKVAEGVAWKVLNAKAAVQSCRRAVDTNPNVVRFAYQLGRALVKARSHGEALIWMQKAAADGHVVAIYALGRMHAKGVGVKKDPAMAARWFHSAAEKGHAGAMAALGAAYGGGSGVPKNDEEAVRWYQRAAEKGHAAAMAALGAAYGVGSGVAKNDQEAVRWHQRAAEQGNRLALANLGTRYLQGRGVEKDVSKALRLLRKSADKGSAVGMHALGWMHAKGIGIEKNPQLAAKLVFQALRLGNAFSVKQMLKRSNAWGVDFRRELQRLMKEAGVYAGPIDSNFNAETKRAIKSLAKR